MPSVNDVVLQDGDLLIWEDEPGYGPSALLVRDGALWFQFHGKPWHEAPHHGLTLEEAQDVLNGRVPFRFGGRLRLHAERGRQSHA